MKLKLTEYRRSSFHFSENDNVIFGYTETDSEIEDIGEYFKTGKIIQLEQVHGNIIYFSDEVEGYPDGDGIILNEINVLAVIRTADCVPLFFRTKDHRFAGVIHIGWQGLYSKIGVNLINILNKNGTDTKDILFFTGPAIEGNCYIVQQDLVDKFRDFTFSDTIFKKIPDGYSMDVKQGIEHCLIEMGVPGKNIEHADICTFCNPNFPSYRRGDREKRIFNFIVLK